MVKLNIRPLTNGNLRHEVRRYTRTPIEQSLKRDFIFEWTGVTGSGRIFYFQIEDENIFPKWFGVLVPDGTTSFDKINIFFHLLARQNDFDDSTYLNLNSWYKIFHYLWDDFGAQFCAARNGQILIVPLMPNSTATTCGILPLEWEQIAGRMLGMIKSRNMTGGAPIQSISCIVVSSFSAGIIYSHHFREQANFGNSLNGLLSIGTESYRMPSNIHKN